MSLGHKVPRSSLPVYQRKRPYGDGPGHVLMVQDRDLFLPETGLGPVPMVQDRDLALLETGPGLSFPGKGFAANNAPCNDKSGCIFGWRSSYPETIIFAFDDPVVEYNFLDIQYNH